jgi:hypothetical protein
VTKGTMSSCAHRAWSGWLSQTRAGPARGCPAWSAAPALHWPSQRGQALQKEGHTQEQSGCDLERSAVRDQPVACPRERCESTVSSAQPTEQRKPVCLRPWSDPAHAPSSQGAAALMGRVHAGSSSTQPTHERGHPPLRPSGSPLAMSIARRRAKALESRFSRAGVTQLAECLLPKQSSAIPGPSWPLRRRRLLPFGGW